MNNAVPTFSSVKWKFGHAVWSKTDTAMVNQVLAKFVCHNVVVCIHEMFAFGITEDIEPKAERPDDGGEAPWLVTFHVK